MHPSDHPTHWTCWLVQYSTLLQRPILTVWPEREPAFKHWSRRMHRRWRSCPYFAAHPYNYQWFYLVRNVIRWRWSWFVRIVPLYQHITREDATVFGYIL